MKETIEEAVKTYYEENIDQSNIPREHYEWEIQDLMLGFAYKWQQEQDKNMFSEEDMKAAWENGMKSAIVLNASFEMWFEQFKNK
jgi:hypothetical protein